MLQGKHSYTPASPPSAINWPQPSTTTSSYMFPFVFNSFATSPPGGVGRLLMASVPLRSSGVSTVIRSPRRSCKPRYTIHLQNRRSQKPPHRRGLLNHVTFTLDPSIPQAIPSTSLARSRTPPTPRRSLLPIRDFLLLDFRPSGGIFPITYHSAPIACPTSAARAGGR